VSLGKPGVYAAVTGSIRLESLFLTLEGSGFELVVCVKFSKLVVGAGTGSFQVNSNIPLFDRLAGCRKRIQVFGCQSRRPAGASGVVRLPPPGYGTPSRRPATGCCRRNGRSACALALRSSRPSPSTASAGR
jgi:hypothetical protein